MHYRLRVEGSAPSVTKAGAYSRREERAKAGLFSLGYERPKNILTFTGHGEKE